MASVPRPEIKAWLEKYPPPENIEPVYVDKEQLLNDLKADHKDYVILDLRDGDFIGGKIDGAIHIPSQSIYESYKEIYDLAEAAQKDKIYVYCMSSRDRAVRTWGWLEDLAQKRGKRVQPLIVKGGYLAWIKGGDEYIDKTESFNLDEIADRL